MERVNALINKLQEQSMEHASAADLLNTVQLLQAELVRHITAPAAAPARTMGTGKVAVVMPNGNAGYGNANYASANGANGTNYANGNTNAVSYTNGANGVAAAGYTTNNNDNDQYSRFQPQPAASEKPVVRVIPMEWEGKVEPVQQEAMAPAPVQKEAPAAAPKEMPEEAPVSITKKEMAAAWPIDPLRDVPTLSHQEQALELNDIIGQQHTSLNDRLKPLQTELSDVLTEAPVRDLKRAIGVNDRYVFVNELFRGDEAMYERSLKTINSFRILPEAEYWMERELKVKLGWDDGKTTTQHFYQLVKRRFS